MSMIRKLAKKNLKKCPLKEIRSVSVDHFDEKKIVRLKTDNYRANWISISGMVKDPAGKPVIAYVAVKGTSELIKTNQDGNFTMKAPEKGVLRVSDNIRPLVEVKVKPTVEIVLKD